MLLGRHRPPPEVFDRGLQQERTVLAWERTAFSLIAIGALLLRGVANPTEHVWLVVLSSVPFVTSAVLLAMAPHRNRKLHERLRGDEDMRAHGSVRLTTFTFIAAAIVAAGIVVAEMVPGL